MEQENHLDRVKGKQDCRGGGLLRTQREFTVCRSSIQKCVSEQDKSE